MRDVAKRLGFAAGVLALLAARTDAEQIIGLTTSNSLVTFDSATPGAVSAPIVIGGDAAGDTNIGIDRRPNGGALYGLGTSNNLYVIDVATGLATLASTITTAPGTTTPGIDFNPVPDRLRVTSPTDTNLRINVDTGATTVDGTLAYAAGDPNAGANPNIVGSAYTNNFAPSPRTPPPGTSLYGIDSTLDILVLQNPPNDGTLNTIGALGFNAAELLGFDISGQGARLAYLSSAGTATTAFYTVDLTTGAATFVGELGNATLLRDIAAPTAVVPEPGTMAMAGVGGLGLLALLRRKARRAP